MPTVVETSAVPDLDLVPSAVEEIPELHADVLASPSKQSITEEDTTTETPESPEVDEEELDGKRTGVDSIPTISQICDPPVNFASSNNNPEECVGGDGGGESCEVGPDELKRRTSLPSNSLDRPENAGEDSVIHVSPQKRPRSASTSTQVDPNLFGEHQPV